MGSEEVKPQPEVVAVPTNVEVLPQQGNVFFDRKQILEAPDEEVVVLYIPEWKTNVRIKRMTGEDAALLSDGPKNEGIMRIVAGSCVDEKGNRIFTLDDVKLLAKKSFRALGRIQTVAAELNGLTMAVQEAMKKV